MKKKKHFEYNCKNIVIDKVNFSFDYFLKCILNFKSMKCTFKANHLIKI